MKPDSSSSEAEAITKASASNLALAFVALPRQRREDITVFYAFCRIVDDIADEPGIDPAERQRRLDDWRRWIEAPGEGEMALAAALRGVIARYSIPLEHFREIISGVEMDLRPRVYETFEELRVYLYRVASAVGLVSIEIFGYEREETRRYALDLGMALQLTNIIRDVGVDLENGGRVYLPLEDLRRFGYDERELRSRVYDERLVKLLSFEANRARLFFHSASVHLPPEDRPAMVAARIMHAVYARLLRRMQYDGFRALEKKYALGRMEKAWLVSKILAGHWLSRLGTAAGGQRHEPLTRDSHE